MTAKSKSKSKSKRHPRGFWRSAGFGALSFCESATPTNNRFPTTTFGNDGYFALGVIPEEFCRGSRSFAREQVRQTTDPGLQHSRMTATANNRFPTTTFGNDDYFALIVIPEGFCRGSVVFCKRTTLTNNGFPTTTFGNDIKRKPRGFWRPAGCGDLVVLQGNKSDEQQILDYDFPG